MIHFGIADSNHSSEGADPETAFGDPPPLFSYETLDEVDTGVAPSASLAVQPPSPPTVDAW